MNHSAEKIFIGLICLLAGLGLFSFMLDRTKGKKRISSIYDFNLYFAAVLGMLCGIVILGEVIVNFLTSK